MSDVINFSSETLFSFWAHTDKPFGTLTIYVNDKSINKNIKIINTLLMINIVHI